jgi:hypothetical protein
VRRGGGLITEFTQQHPATKLMLPWPVFTNMRCLFNQANLKRQQG